MDERDSAQPQAAGSDGFTYRYSVPELVNLASFRLTLDLWSGSLQDPLDDLEKTFQNRIDNLTKKLSKKISRSTKYKISWISKRILKLSSNWILYHEKHVFENCDIELIRGMCLPELKWRPDGSIDSLESARALANSAMLSVEQEYKLVCLYCMEKRIANMWPELADDESIALDTFFDQNLSLVSYWNSRMAGYCSESGLKSVESRLISNDVVDNLSAAVYFLDRFKPEDRVEKGCQVIPGVKLEERAEFVKIMISKFSDEELLRAFRSHCSDIMYPLIMNSTYNRYAFQVWNHVKNTLTLQSFLSLMIRITGTLRVASKYRTRRIRFPNKLFDYEDLCQNIFAIVGEIWRITPSPLKRHNLTSSVRGVSYSLAEYFVTMNMARDPELKFLFIILSDANVTVRERFLYKYMQKLHLLCKTQVLRYLVYFCNCPLGEDDAEMKPISRRNYTRMLDRFF